VNIAARTCARLTMLIVAAVAAPAVALAAPPPHKAAPPAAPATSSKDCFEELETGTSAEFTCTYPVALADQERADLKRITREYLQDVTCSVEVNINRGLVERAVGDRNFVFESPPQPVVCDVKTKSSNMHITATFAPKVTFKDGQAVEGTPGLDNIKGVTRILSWPVKQYVNRAPHVRNTMLQIINAYRKHRASKAR
jgi:hypothetical protein